MTVYKTNAWKGDNNLGPFLINTEPSSGLKLSSVMNHHKQYKNPRQGIIYVMYTDPLLGYLYSP